MGLVQGLVTASIVEVLFTSLFARMLFIMFDIAENKPFEMFLHVYIIVSWS